MTDPPAPSESGHLADLRLFLLRTIMRRFGVVRPLRGGMLPGPPSPAIALVAADCESGGMLLRLACDAWDVALGDLAVRAGVGQTVLSMYIMGKTPMDREGAKAVSSALSTIVGERSGTR